MSKAGSSSAASYIWDEWTEDDDNDSGSISYQALMNNKTKPNPPPVTEKPSFLSEKKHFREATNSNSTVRSNNSHPPIAPHKSPSRGALPPQLDDYRDYFNSQDTKADSSEFQRRVTKITAADLEKVRNICNVY
jgi:hypothetical protein